MSFASTIITLALIIGAFFRRRMGETGGNILKLLAIAAGLATSLIWALLDNLDDPMALFNENTPWVGIAFAVELAFVMFYNVSKRSSGSELKPESGYVRF
jgi:hypothetical protein